MKNSSVTKKIRFHTSEYAPNYQVTLLCNDSLKGSPIYGEYYERAWHFDLVLNSELHTSTVVFALNNEVTMEQAPLEVHRDVAMYDWSDEDISFQAGGYTQRHRHHIDRLVTEDNDFQRRYIPSNLDERIVYDVIVVGSGMGGGIVADTLSDKGLNVLVLEGGS